MNSGLRLHFVKHTKIKTGNIRNVKNGFWEQYYEENCFNKWYSNFEQGNNSVTDELRAGCPSSISTKKNRNSQRAVGLGSSDDF